MLFISIGYIYLYFFQGDLMSMTQHILSHGRTTYHITLYTLIIMSVLTVLGIVISRFLYLPIRTLALAWFPSCWILGLMTRVSLHIPGVQNDSASIWWFVISAIIYLFSLVLAQLYNQNRNENSSLSTLLSPNLALMVLSFSFLFATGNTNRLIHDELRLEKYAYNEDYDEVISHTDRKSMLSRPMMYLRTYALSKQGKLGDELFTHPYLLGSDALLPQLIDSLRPYNMPSAFRKHLGGMPIHDMSVTNFMRYLTADSLCSNTAKEYLLCALLLDCNIDEFRDSLASFYIPSDSLAQFDQLLKNRKPWIKKSNIDTKTMSIANLPRHFAEALTLDNAHNPSPISVLTPEKNRVNIFIEPSDTTFNANYKIFLQDSLGASDTYKKTYWYYYHQEKKANN